MRNDHILLREYGITPEHAIYPGHPVTLAFLIVKNYETIRKAFEPTATNFAHALGNSDIPGAGGNVSNALGVLKDLFLGSSFADAMAVADDLWGRCDSQKAAGEKLRRRWQDGQDQADKIKPLLEACKNWWS